MIRKLFDKYGCDKGRKHGYDVYYQKLFDSYDKNINILEIGVFRGDSTLATHEYLEDATIYGVDIFERVDIKAVRSRFNSDRVHLEKCDPDKKYSPSGLIMSKSWTLLLLKNNLLITPLSLTQEKSS